MYLKISRSAESCSIARTIHMSINTIEQYSGLNSVILYTYFHIYKTYFRKCKKKCRHEKFDMITCVIADGTCIRDCIASCIFLKRL